MFVLRTVPILLATTVLSSTIQSPSKTNNLPEYGKVKVETISVLPWAFSHGTDGAIKTAKEFLDTLLTKVKIEGVSEVRTLAAWEQVNRSSYSTREGALASPAEMLRVGTQLGTDWVMSGSAEWHSRSIWVGFGFKTKSNCKINLRIVDVRKKMTVLDVRDLETDSTAKEDFAKVALAIFVTPLVTVISGGPKTPHEQRAVQLGIAQALQPWLLQRLKPMPIDPKGK